VAATTALLKKQRLRKKCGLLSDCKRALMIMSYLTPASQTASVRIPDQKPQLLYQETFTRYSMFWKSTFGKTLEIYLRAYPPHCNAFIQLTSLGQNISSLNYRHTIHINSHFSETAYLLTYGAEPFLRSCQLCSHSRNSQHFMKPEGSSQCSQEPSNGPYPEPDQPSPHHPIPSYPLRSILILSTHLRLGLPSGLLPI
jgi:hypothetical protein